MAEMAAFLMDEVFPHVTSRIEPGEGGLYPLRIFLRAGEAGVEKDSVILVDQIISWDNRRIIKRLGELPPQKAERLKDALVEFFGFAN